MAEAMFLSLQQMLHVALHLTGAQAAGANIQGSGGAINDSADALDVGSPGTLGLADGVADAVAVHSRLSADLTELSHCKNLLMMRKIIQNQNMIILTEKSPFGKCFFTDIQDFHIKSRKLPVNAKKKERKT